MIRSITSFSTLLLGMGVFLAGSALLGLLLGLRGADLGFTNLTIGLVMSGFYIGYVIGAWLCPAIIQQVGHIRAFTAFAAGSSAAALACGLIDHPLAWWLLRIVNGILLMGLFMVVESWLLERRNDSGKRHQGQLFSIYMMVCLIAIAIGQYLLLIYGPQSVNSFVIVAILFSLALIPVALTPVSQPAPIRTDRVSAGRLFRVSPVGATGALFSGLIYGSFWSLAAIFGRDIGLPNEQVATFIVVTIIGGALLQWPIGWSSDHFDRRYVMLISSLVSAAAMAVLLIWGRHSTAALFGSAFVFGGFSFSLYGLAIAQAHDRFLSHEVLEATRGVLLVHGIGAALGPVLTGYAMTWLFGGFAISLSIICITLAAFVGLRIKLDPPVPAAERTTFSPMEQTSPVAMDLDPRTPDADPIDDSDVPAMQPTPDVVDLPTDQAEADLLPAGTG